MLTDISGQQENDVEVLKMLEAGKQTLKLVVMFVCIDGCLTEVIKISKKLHLPMHTSVTF